MFDQIKRRGSSVLIALLLISTSLILTAYVYSSTTQVREALAEEILFQQQDVANLLQEYSAVMISLERFRLLKQDAQHIELSQALKTAKIKLDTMRANYSFANLDGATEAHAFAKPVLEDVQQWLSEGLHGYHFSEDVVLQLASVRLGERYDSLRNIAADTDASATSLISEQSLYLDNFRNSLIILLAAFAMLAMGIVSLLTRQRDLQAQLVIDKDQTAQKLIEAETHGREQAEAALQGSEQFLLSTLDALPSNIAILDDSGEILAANTPWKNLVNKNNSLFDTGGIGADYQSVLKSTASSELEKRGIAEAIRQADEVLSGDRDIMFHEYPYSSGDSQSWALISTKVFSNGTEKNAVLIHEDVTRRKKLEERDRRLRAELAHASRLTTAGELASGLAHELNQPLTAISHNCDAVISSINGQYKADPVLMQTLDDIYEQAQNAGGIIRGMRQLVRKETNETVQTDINNLVQETLRLTQPEARENKINVILNLGQNLPAPYIDPIQIQQVLVNLERNSVEAMRNSNSTVRELTITTAIDSPDYIRISVQDTGPGIETEIKRQLFTAFQTTKPDGMGLGLSICRNIVEDHGGRLWVDEDAKGVTLFHFTVPFVKL